MSLSDELLEVIDRRVAVAMRRRRRTSSHGTVTSTSPLEVQLDGDASGHAVRQVAQPSLTLSVGDVVGMVRFGSRWYVTCVLKEA